MERTGSKISHENLLVFIILEKSCILHVPMQNEHLVQYLVRKLLDMHKQIKLSPPC